MCSVEYTSLSLLEKELNTLLNEWDPIGIFPFEWWPEDEYTCFIYPTLSILKNDKGIDEMVWFLESHLTEHIWLNMPNREYTTAFASKVYRWWWEK